MINRTVVLAIVCTFLSLPALGDSLTSIKIENDPSKIWINNLGLGLAGGALAGVGLIFASHKPFSTNGSSFSQEAMILGLFVGAAAGAAHAYFEIKSENELKLQIMPGSAKLEF